MSEEIIKKFNRSRDYLTEVLSHLSEEVMDNQYGDGWTIREILTHLWSGEQDMCRMMIRIVRDELSHLPGANFSLHEYNKQRVAAISKMTLAELAKGLEVQRARTIALLHTFTPEQLQKRGYHPVGGEASVADIFKIISFHEQSHAQEIASVL